MTGKPKYATLVLGFVQNSVASRHTVVQQDEVIGPLQRFEGVVSTVRLVGMQTGPLQQGNECRAYRRVRGNDEHFHAHHLWNRLCPTYVVTHW
jgi:hypothetical protein